MTWQYISNGGKALARTVTATYPKAFTKNVYAWHWSGEKSSNSADYAPRRTAMTTTYSTYYMDPAGTLADIGAWFTHIGY